MLLHGRAQGGKTSGDGAVHPGMLTGRPRPFHSVKAAQMNRLTANCRLPSRSGTLLQLKCLISSTAAFHDPPDFRHRRCGVFIGEGHCLGFTRRPFSRRADSRSPCMKLDPYINVDPGTMSPFQHGEVFVTDDGAETDLDLGHYERFIRTPPDRRTSTSPPARSTRRVIAQRAPRRLPRRHRAGDPAHHRRDQAPHHRSAHGEPTWRMVEIGGTVGDIESLPFLEAIRQLRIEYGAGEARCSCT